MSLLACMCSALMHRLSSDVLVDHAVQKGQLFKIHVKPKLIGRHIKRTWENTLTTRMQSLTCWRVISTDIGKWSLECVT